MNIHKLEELLLTVRIAGMRELVLDKCPDTGRTMAYAADDSDKGLETGEHDPSIVLISEIDSDIVDHSMGIHRVDIFLKRLALFDIDKVKVNQKNNDDFVTSLEFKEGRKKATVTLSSPATIDVPDGTIEDNIVDSVIFKKSYVEHLVKANSAMNSEMLSLSGINKDIVLELYDGFSDTLEDVVGSTHNEDWQYNWRMSSILKLLRHQITKGKMDEVELGIGECGILYIEVGSILFMIMPQEI
jgi:hypothetical protein